jgi:hypothetical protein
MNTQVIEKTIVIVAACATIVSALIACQQAIASAEQVQQPVVVPCVQNQ